MHLRLWMKAMMGVRDSDGEILGVVGVVEDELRLWRERAGNPGADPSTKHSVPLPLPLPSSFSAIPSILALPPSEAHLEIPFTPGNNIHAWQHRVSPLAGPSRPSENVCSTIPGPGFPIPTPYPVSPSPSTSPTSTTHPHTQCFRSPVSSSSGASPPPPRPAQPSTK